MHFMHIVSKAATQTHINTHKNEVQIIISSVQREQNFAFYFSTPSVVISNTYTRRNVFPQDLATDLRPRNASA